MSLDKARLRGYGRKVLENRVESFDMAHLQQQIFFSRHLNQPCCLRGFLCHRFFNEHMFARAQTPAGEFKMRRRRRHNAQRVAGGDRLVRRAKRPAAVLFSQSASGFGFDVIYS